MIVKTDCETDGALHSTNKYTLIALATSTTTTSIPHPIHTLTDPDWKISHLGSRYSLEETGNKAIHWLWGGTSRTGANLQPRYIYLSRCGMSDV